MVYDLTDGNGIFPILTKPITDEPWLHKKQLVTINRWDGKLPSHLFMRSALYATLLQFYPAFLYRTSALRPVSALFLLFLENN